MKHVTIGAAIMLSAGIAQAADFRLTLREVGTRDYYCTTTLQVENDGGATLDDLNGAVVLLVDGEEVATSRFASFLMVDPGGSATATFETPDGPCAEITGYRFVIGACRIDQSFQDLEACAARVEAASPIEAVRPR